MIVYPPVGVSNGLLPATDVGNLMENIMVKYM